MKCLSVLHKLFAPLLLSALYSSGFSLLVQLLIFPWDIREEFGAGRVKVSATFDALPYDGSIVNMGVKDAHGKPCYIIGVLKAIRKQLGKGDGDLVHVVITKR